MKPLKIASLIFGCAVMGAANAADITIFHSPSCPHCRHAREFIESTLIYEYGDLKVTEINVMESDNRQAFIDTLQKCEYKSGGVPVIVVGDKCFQGYADSMQDTLRAAIEIDLTDAQKQSAADNKSQMAQGKDAFVKSHQDRKQAIISQEGKKK